MWKINTQGFGTECLRIQIRSENTSRIFITGFQGETHSRLIFKSSVHLHSVRISWECPAGLSKYKDYTVLVCAFVGVFSSPENATSLLNPDSYAGKNRIHYYRGWFQSDSELNSSRNQCSMPSRIWIRSESLYHTESQQKANRTCRMYINATHVIQWSSDWWAEKRSQLN